MTDPRILGNLHNLHEMQAQLLASLPREEAARQYRPTLGSLGWLFGYGVYLELYWLREILVGDGNLSQRVEHLFRPGKLSLTEQCMQLPPVDHLLNWAEEIRDDHLMRLANPGMLPAHEYLKSDRLQWFLLQEQARIYESMLLVLNQRQLLAQDANYPVLQPLTAAEPHWQTKELSSGHFRIGARDDPRAYDNELPPQAVELSSFRIALQPVTNGQYLAFMQANGYLEHSLWTDAGRQWLQTQTNHHPEYWRQDADGNWHLIGINGPSDLPRDEPVSGISQHEAQAFANWAATTDELYAGAVLQHEYQWEIAARSGVIQQTGRAWEWCSNPFHPYPDFQPFPDEATSATDFANGLISLRGGCIHSQQVLRRASYRNRAPATQRFSLSGLRLVFPPRHKWT
jgi:iron(II)-dependent oxidoreductase